jgi:hypothetical protein
VAQRIAIGRAERVADPARSWTEGANTYYQNENKVISLSTYFTYGSYRGMTISMKWSGWCFERLA